MAANTICMSFKVGAELLKKEEMRSRLVRMCELSLGPLDRDPTVLQVGTERREMLVIGTGQDGSHVTLRTYSHGLITLDAQHLVTSFEKRPSNQSELKVQVPFGVGNRRLHLSEEYIRRLEGRLKEFLGADCLESNSLFTPIKRGAPVWSYVITADERLMELDYDRLVFEADSPWQNIRIFHSTEHGNVLFLDADLMLGESDLIYTETLIGVGREDFCGRTALILGGGDGGILHELLKQNPEHVTMAEIDVEVIRACRTHMRSVCGDAMDTFEGPHHTIVIEDCVKVLHESIEAGNLFDYVINDLTEFPVEKAVKGYNYDFETTSLITELSLRALKPGGKLLARGNCASADDYHGRFESDLRTLGVHFRRRDVFVPSFHETYCLYEIWKPLSNGTAH